MSFYIDDIEIFFTDFAKSASYSHASSAAVSIKVIYEAAYRPLDPLTGLSVESARPAAICKSSDVSAATQNDTLSINGTTYYVIEVEPDGEGMTVLLLSEDQG